MRNFNEEIMHQTRKFSSFYLKHDKQNASLLILQITFDLINRFITSLLLALPKRGGDVKPYIDNETVFKNFWVPL